MEKKIIERVKIYFTLHALYCILSNITLQNHVNDYEIANLPLEVFRISNISLILTPTLL